MLSRDNSVPPDLVSKIRTYRKRYFEPKFMEIIKAAKTSKLRTITHGDFWNNNMMINDDNPGNKKSQKVKMTLLLSNSKHRGHQGESLGLPNDERG